MLRLSATQTPTTTTTTRSVTASQPQPQATLHATASHSHSDGDDDDGGGGWTDAPANKRRQRSTLAATSSTRTQPRQTHATRVQQTSAVRIAGTPSSAARVARPGLLPLPANAVPTDLMTTTAGASTSSSHSSTSSHGVGGAVPGNGKNARGRALTIADLISIATNMSNPKRTNKTIRSEVTPATASVSQITRRRVLAMAPTAQAALPRHAAAASSKFNGRSAHPNKLDGSSPAIRAGKQSRATTKRHRPSRMRKIIRRDRQLRKRVALAGKASASSSAAATESAVLQPSSPQTAPAMPEAVASTSTTATQDSRPGNSSDMHQASTSASEMETREKDNNGDDDAGDDEFDPEVIAAERLTATMHRFRITSSAMKHHSARFREYCSQKVGAELDSATAIVLKQLHKFQERRLATIDPNKAKQRRWFVVGLKEVFKHLQRGKLRCLIVAPDIESVRSAGGLDDAISSILTEAHAQDRPVVFALNRRKIARALNIHVPVSAVGIFTFDGLHQEYKSMLLQSTEGRLAYFAMLEATHAQWVETPPPTALADSSAPSGSTTPSSSNSVDHAPVPLTEPIAPRASSAASRQTHPNESANRGGAPASRKQRRQQQKAVSATVNAELAHS